MNKEGAKKPILDEFENGTPYPFQPWLINTLDEKAKRKLEKGKLDPQFDQTKLDDIPYMYRHEVRVCYIHGEFFATIIFSGAIVEYILRLKLSEKRRVPRGFKEVIKKSREENIIDEKLKEDAMRVKSLRDLIAHPYDKEWDEIKEKVKKHPDIPQLEEIASECIEKMENILGHFYPLEF